jgi:hypothetical protein
MQPDKSRKLVHALTIVVVGLILTLPALVYGFPRITDDATAHALWASNFSRQFWSGDLYPRWLINMNGGLGSPTFFYYPPLAYFLTALLQPLLPDDPHAWRQLGVSVSLALILSGLCAYLWLRSLAHQNVALAAALLYMMMPYHLAVDLYTRGAFAEFWAFVWMPLILYFVIGVVKERRGALIGLAISYALLCLTHLPVTLIFSVFPVAYGLWKAERQRRWNTLWRVVAAMSLGIGLSAIFLLPALTTQDYVLVNFLKEGSFNYDKFFLFTSLRLWGDGTSKLTLMVMVVLLMGIFAAHLSRASEEARRERLFWIVVSTLSLLMMMSLSKPLWRAFASLQMIQFPFRFNVILTLSVTALLLLGLSAIKRPLTKARVLSLSGIAAAVCVCLLVTFLAAKSAYPVFNPLPEVLLAEQEERLISKEDTWEYWPRWSEGFNRQALLQKIKGSGNYLEAQEDCEAQGRTTVRSWKPRDILLETELTKDCTLIVHQLYYPGWSARLAGSAHLLPVEPSGDGGLLSVRVPAGAHQVSLRLESGWPEQSGRVVSAASVVIILLLILYDYYKHSENQPQRRGGTGQKEAEDVLP